MLALLFLVAVVAGALNVVAGGGSFLGLPALLYAGVAPVTANATTSFAMLPAAVASAVAYRSHIRVRQKLLLPLSLVSFAGGLLGGQLLLHTSDVNFMRALPWLMLLATLTLTFGALAPAGALRESGRQMGWWLLLLQLGIATYGGYFSGGIGIMMLAGMSAAGMSDIHEMNGLKMLLTLAINGVAVVEFLIHGAVAWSPGLVMAAGGIAGGYAGAALARELPPRRVQTFVTAVAWVLTVYFFAGAS